MKGDNYIWKEGGMKMIELCDNIVNLIGDGKRGSFFCSFFSKIGGKLRWKLWEELV